MAYSKSPLNYTGGKYKLLPQIVPFFPTNINNLFDLFAGGCNVCTNVDAKSIYANDINNYVINIYKAFQKMDIDTLLSTIDNIIEDWNLSKTNKDSYLAFRKHCNKMPLSKRNPIELYVLVCYSFNYQFRFNNKQEFNNPFGNNRSSFNPTMRQNLISFHSKLDNIQFMSSNFKQLDLSFLSKGDFLYADPPYRITTAAYNDGKRGFEGWSKNDDLFLFSLLDNLDDRGVKFALSNVIEHKGFMNNELLDWVNCKDYKLHKINYNYNNCNYQTKNKAHKTQEVLITNY